MKSKITVTCVISIMLCIFLVLSCAASQNKISFSDVPETYWGYKTIMDMTGKGLFKGTTEPVNNVGTFLPESSMTRAEFIVVALRALCPQKAHNAANFFDKVWWDGYYNLELR